MSLFRKLTATLITVFAPQAASWALQWPVEPVLSAPGIVKQLGDWDASGLHRAIDIPRAAGTTVRSVEDGCVIALDVAQEAIIIAQACGTASSEGWAYVHALNTVGLTTGALVVAGQTIGEVSGRFTGTSIPNHLHFGRQDNPLLEPNIFAGQIPRNPLLFYQDNLPASVALLEEAAISFVPDQTTNQAAFTSVGARLVIFENVDVIAEAHNKIVNETRAGVYSISFGVSGGPAASTEIAERTLAAFRQMPFAETTTGAGSRFSLIYAPGLSTDFRGTYVITNSGTQTPLLSNGVSNVIENAWFTRARSGVNDSAGGLTAAQMARANIEAKYPDGKYLVAIKAGTFLNGHVASRTREVCVDNFRPILASVMIGSPTKFAKQWNWDGTKFASADPNPNEPLAAGSHSLYIGLQRTSDNAVGVVRWQRRPHRESRVQRPGR